MKSTHAKQLYPIGLIALSLFFLLMVVPLLRRGMFVDGVIYAAIAKNLSLGIGSIWKPFYTQTLYPEFYEHPPLALFLQSLLFKLFGPHYLVERFYCLFAALSQLAIISYLWLKMSRASIASLGLLLFIWLLVPLNLINKSNMLEGTLTVFSLLACVFLFEKNSSQRAQSIRYIMASFALLAAFLSKGPTALFPLVVPSLLELFDRTPNISRGLKNGFKFCVITSLIFSGFFWFVPEALHNIKHYFELQLIASVAGARGQNYNGWHHLHIVFLYFRAVLPVVIFTTVCVYWEARLKSIRFTSNLKDRIKEKHVLLFFVLSLLASLPVGISPRQSFSYIMQSAPFITLAAMFFCYQSFQTIAGYCTTKARLFLCIRYLSGIFLCLSILFSMNQFERYNRDQMMLTDIRYLVNHLQSQGTLSTSLTIYNNWYPGAYFARLSAISLTNRPGQRYFLALRGEKFPPPYVPVVLPLSYFSLGMLG